MKPSVAYVDDDIQNLFFYQEILAEHFEVTTFARGLDLIDALKEKTFECIILDIYMPVLDGFQLYEKIRQNPLYTKTPVFFMTATPHDELRITSYQKGCADFFDRLIRREELIVRLGARIRAHREMNSTFTLGNLTLDAHQIDCRVSGRKLDLTLLEFKILKRIVQAYPQKLSKDELVKSLWGSDSISANNLNTHLYNLRTKLELWDHCISNHRYQGYFVEPSEQAQSHA